MPLEDADCWQASLSLSLWLPLGQGPFEGCSSAASITIPSCVTNIRENAFEGCGANITIPESVTGIGDNAFWRCRLLASITILKSVWQASATMRIADPLSKSGLGLGGSADWTFPYHWITGRKTHVFWFLGSETMLDLRLCWLFKQVQFPLYLWFDGCLSHIVYLEMRCLPHLQIGLSFEFYTSYLGEVSGDVKEEIQGWWMLVVYTHIYITYIYLYSIYHLQSMHYNVPRSYLFVVHNKHSRHFCFAAAGKHQSFQGLVRLSNSTLLFVGGWQVSSDM